MATATILDMAPAAILDLGVKMMSKHFADHLKSFGVPNIVKNDTLFVIIAYPLCNRLIFLFSNVAMAAILDFEGQDDTQTLWIWS